MSVTPRMRTIKQAINELKTQDSETAFTESALRRAIAAHRCKVIVNCGCTIFTLQIV